MLPLGDPGVQSEQLPFAIELWDAANRDVERVVARAFNASLAREIFKGAHKEYPERRVTLRRGGRILADSSR